MHASREAVLIEHRGQCLAHGTQLHYCSGKQGPGYELVKVGHTETVGSIAFTACTHNAPRVTFCIAYSTIHKASLAVGELSFFRGYGDILS
jgi:hypothetical protein